MQQGLDYAEFINMINKADKATGELGKLHTLYDGKYGKVMVAPGAICLIGDASVKLHGTLRGSHDIGFSERWLNKPQPYWWQEGWSEDWKDFVWDYPDLELSLPDQPLGR